MADEKLVVLKVVDGCVALKFPSLESAPDQRVHGKDDQRVLRKRLRALENFFTQDFKLKVKATDNPQTDEIELKVIEYEEYDQSFAKPQPVRDSRPVDCEYEPLGDRQAQRTSRLVRGDKVSNGAAKPTEIWVKCATGDTEPAPQIEVPAVCLMSDSELVDAGENRAVTDQVQALIAWELLMRQWRSGGDAATIVTELEHLVQRCGPFTNAVLYSIGRVLEATKGFEAARRYYADAATARNSPTVPPHPSARYRLAAAELERCSLSEDDPENRAAVSKASEVLEELVGTDNFHAAATSLARHHMRKVGEQHAKRAEELLGKAEAHDADAVLLKATFLEQRHSAEKARQYLRAAHERLKTGEWRAAYSLFPSSPAEARLRVGLALVCHEEDPSERVRLAEGYLSELSRATGGRLACSDTARMQLALGKALYAGGACDQALRLLELAAQSAVAGGVPCFIASAAVLCAVKCRLVLGDRAPHRNVVDDLGYVLRFGTADEAKEAGRLILERAYDRDELVSPEFARVAALVQPEHPYSHLVRARFAFADAAANDESSRQAAIANAARHCLTYVRAFEAHKAALATDSVQSPDVAMADAVANDESAERLEARLRAPPAARRPPDSWVHLMIALQLAELPAAAELFRDALEKARRPELKDSRSPGKDDGAASAATFYLGLHTHNPALIAEAVRGGCVRAMLYEAQRLREEGKRAEALLMALRAGGQLEEAADLVETLLTEMRDAGDDDASTSASAPSEPPRRQKRVLYCPTLLSVRLRNSRNFRESANETAPKKRPRGWKKKFTLLCNAVFNHDNDEDPALQHFPRYTAISN